MKVLVTGGAGFIGSHLADALLSEGHEVHIVDNLSSGRRGNIPEDARFHELDIRDEQTASLMAAERFDALCHCAAQMDVRHSVADPAFDASVNLLGLINLMEAAKKSGVKSVVFSSTGGAIYGDPVRVPQDEDHPLEPISPYGIAKLAGEHYLRFYAGATGCRCVALRYANVYGPRQNPHGEAGVVAIFTGRMLGGEPCTVFGNGELTRDYVYVGDVVRANLLVLTGGISGVYNVGTGVETSVNDLFARLAGLTGYEQEPIRAAARTGEQQRSVLGIRRIKEELGWEPKWSLGQGLSETVAWFRHRGDD